LAILEELVRRGVLVRHAVALRAGLDRLLARPDEADSKRCQVPSLPWNDLDTARAETPRVPRSAVRDRAPCRAGSCALPCAICAGQLAPALIRASATIFSKSAL